jgi:chromosome segregation ATPase
MTARIETLRTSIADLEYQASTVAAEKEKEEQAIAAITARLEEARQRADLLAAQLSDLNRHAAEVRDLRAGIEVQRAEAQARLNFCARELRGGIETSHSKIWRENRKFQQSLISIPHSRVWKNCALVSKASVAST